MSKPDGGSAFPQCLYNMRGGYDISGGMSLRDYFAGEALHGAWCANQFVDKFKWGEVAKRCYEAADAMLKAREE